MMNFILLAALFDCSPAAASKQFESTYPYGYYEESIDSVIDHVDVYNVISVICED